MEITKEDQIRWGKMAGQIVKERCAAETAIKKEQYELDPKLCINCQAIIPFEKRENKFCNKSCAATYNNKGISRNKKLTVPCIVCDIPISKKGGQGHDRKYCNGCSPLTKWEVRKQQFTENGYIFGKAQGTLPYYVRRYLNETRDHICVLCGNTEWQGQPIPLVSDHIDGNPHNHQLDNLRLICNNCDALLPTYKSKNRGNGRNFRYNNGKTKEETS